MAEMQTTFAAQRLMELLVQLHIRPGDVIDWGRVTKMWDAGGLSNDAELKAATDNAAARGLLQVNGDQHVLTEKGYGEGRGLPVTAVRWAEDVVEILAAFFNERGGDSFTVDELRQRWQLSREHRPDDLAAGLEYGVQQGWFTKTDDKNYILTTKGRAQV
ncbi:MAG TPA: hypothetical protein VGM47_05630 [Gammaproteobacteria bacterium]|jgi:hypothetical protein